MLVMCILVGLGLGLALDTWLKTKPWFTLFFMLLGIIAGFYNIVKVVRSLNKKDNK